MSCLFPIRVLLVPVKERTNIVVLQKSENKYSHADRRSDFFFFFFFIPKKQLQEFVRLARCGS